EQGSSEWLQARLGLLTASEMKLIMTAAKLLYANNEKAATHLFDIAAQRITDYIEPAFCGYDMQRGQFEEQEARQVYDTHYSKTDLCGFVTNDKWGFHLGYSPDALVGEDGLIECKSRKSKFQVQTIIDNEVPPEFMIQIQTGLLVTERAWMDFISYSGGMPMFVKRVTPSKIIQDAIIAVATEFHRRLDEILILYKNNAEQFYMTERKIYEYMDDVITIETPADKKALLNFDKDLPGNKENFLFGKVKP
ncbi:MAG: lambda exonuclease family protein, partial [Rhizobiaceae bacterium]